MILTKNYPRINKPNIARQPNEKYLQMVTEIDDTVIEFDPAKLGIRKYYEMCFAVLLAALKKAFKKMSLSSFTKRLNNADGLRDDALYALISVLKAYLRSQNENIRIAAQKILDKINSYGNIPKKPLDGQTASSSDLIDDLEKNFAAEITLLKIEDFIADVKKTNSDFIALMKERYKESRAKSDWTVREVRSEFDEVLRNTFSLVEVSAATEDDEIYPKFIKALNVIFARYGATSSTTGKNGDGVGNIAPDVPQDYPDAKEWLEDLPFQGVENGDIYYILVAGKKVFYKLIDKQKFFWHPESEKAAGGWEKLN